MSITTRFRMLEARERALVALAVLLDGLDAPDYFGGDRERGLTLSRASKDLAKLTPEVRLPLVGSLLRTALIDMRLKDDVALQSMKHDQHDNRREGDEQ